MLKALDSFNHLTHIEEAEPGKMYYCQVCKQPVLQRRGKIRIHHFAHYSPKGTHGEYVPCSDTWSYDMTEWHMEWQNRFDYSCIEKVVEANNKRHIADVLVGNIVVEFQHSPISIEDFRERNEFYTAKGYKVIWVFDLTEEFENQRIRMEEDSDNSYRWAYVKKVFKDIHPEEEQATIYLQFYLEDDEESGVMERVTKSYDEFKVFYTDASHSLSIPQFVKMVNENSASLFPPPKPKPAPESIEGCKKVTELWKENYTGMIVKNISNDKVMIINGKEGRMYHKRDDFSKIIGKYCYQDFVTGLYRPNGDYYVVWDSDKSIWKLIYAYVDKDYEKKKAEMQKLEEEKAERLRKENEYYNSIPNKIDGCFSLYEIIRYTRESSMMVKNMHNGKVYHLIFVNVGRAFPPAFYAYEADMESGEIGTIHCNGELHRLSSKEIWNKI